MEKYFDTRLDSRYRANADRIWASIARDISRRVHGPSDGSIRRVLDLGAGYGDFINQVIAGEKWAVDEWPQFQKALAAGVTGIVGDIRSPIEGLPKNHFDLIFLSNVLEHFTIADAASVLAQAKTYLGSDGVLAILQPNFTYCSRHYFDDYTHKTVFTAEGLGCFLRDQGFEIQGVWPRYLPFSFKSRVPRPLWLVELYLKLPVKPLAAQMLILAKLRREKPRREN